MDDPIPPKSDRVDSLNMQVHKIIWRAKNEWDLHLVDILGVMCLNAMFEVLEAWGVSVPLEGDDDDEYDDYDDDDEDEEW